LVRFMSADARSSTSLTRRAGSMHCSRGERAYQAFARTPWRNASAGI
jgi:hypothetical protein